MSADARLTVRVPEALQSRIDDVARESGTNRSQAVRVLLEAALESDAALTALEEVGTDLARLRKILITRLGAELRELTPRIIEDILREEGV